MHLSHHYNPIKMSYFFLIYKAVKKTFLHFPTHFEKFGFSEHSLYRVKFRKSIHSKTSKIISRFTAKGSQGM